MSFVLTTGSFLAIEKEFCESFQAALKNRQDPLRDHHLILVPSAALRKHLLRLLLEAGCRSFSAVRILSLNGLAQEILMDSVQEPYSALDDPIYFTLALQSAAGRLGLKNFQAYRTSKRLLSTFRDLVDGLLTPELLEQFLEQAAGDPDLQKHTGNLRELHDLNRLYQSFLETLRNQAIFNVQYSAALSVEHVETWLSSKNMRALHIYGFYDATPAQFELMEMLSRHVHVSDGLIHWYFPFRVSSNSVEHPAQYAQEFFETLHSLTIKLGGEIRSLPEWPPQASQGLESSFFKLTSATELPARNVHVFSAGSPYEEAWVIAKKILQLVLDHGVKFDQIGVIARSLEPCRAAFQHVFDENQIPHSIPKDPVLCSSTAGHFAFLLLLAKQSHLNHNLVFELLCSPLLSNPFTPAGIVRELLEILFITNSDDWHRLKPIAEEQKKLPEIFELSDEDPRVPLFRSAAAYLMRLKEQIDQIPLNGRFSDFAQALQGLVAEIADLHRYEEAGGMELDLLLNRLADLPLTTEFHLNEFVEIFQDYLTNTAGGLEVRSPTGVTIGDVMSLRGVTFEYTFVVGLNQDVWPLRPSEDPFLPDATRAVIRSTTGAGPYIKRSGDEELLLFAMALRSGIKELYLSYQRADADGRTKSASIYIEEAIRLLQADVEDFPRHLEKRLQPNYLPAPHECATLVRRYSPYEVLLQLHEIPSDYVDRTFEFAEKLNSMDRTAAAPIDGILHEPAELWKSLSDGKLRFSYSRIKEFVKCGFSFYSDRILKLQPSPFKPTEIPHDLTPLVRGRIAESVVKEAIPKLKAGGITVEEAVQSAESKLRRKYAPYLPKVLLDHYLFQFSRAASVLLHYLQEQGYDFKYAEVPDRGYMPEITLLTEAEGMLNIYGIPDLLFYGSKKLIGEMKWGAAATAGTPDSMFTKGELQFCFYPELERQHRQLLEPSDFRYFRLNVYGDLGSPAQLELKLRQLRSPVNLDTTLRVFGSAPTEEDVAENFERLKETGRQILKGEFKILEDPNDYWSPCTTCVYILMCRRTHSATLLRAKKEGHREIDGIAGKSE